MKDGTVLLRQIHPAWMQGDLPTSMAFKPSKSHNGILSAYDGSRIAADEAWKHFTTTLRLASCGVQGILVSECEACELAVVADGQGFPEHVGIDFSPHPNGRREKIAKKLQAQAAARGWLFRQ